MTMTTSAVVRRIRRQYRLLLFFGALSLLGCPSQHLRSALDQRIAELGADVPPPASTETFQVGVAAMIPAVEERVRQQLSAIGGTVLQDVGALGLPETDGIEVKVRWDELVSEIRPAPRLGPSALFLLLAVPGTVRTDTGVLSVENQLRMSARLPLTIEAAVVDGSGLQLSARLASVEDLLVAVSLEGVPPGMDSALSAAIQAAVRERVRTSPQDAITLLRTERLLPDLADLPLGSARVLVFPSGRPTVFVGLQTSLPIDAEPGVVPAQLLPGESDWIARVDEAVVAAALARAGLTGGLRIVKPPDRLEVTELRLTEQGFGAWMVMWRLRPPCGTHELRATGEIGWQAGAFRLTIRTLERRDGGPIPGRKRPWVFESPLPAALWIIDDLSTTDGALVVRGRLP